MKIVFNGLLVSFILLAAFDAKSAELLGWDSSGLSNFGPSPWAPTFVAAGFSLSETDGASRGPGIATTIVSAVANGWGASSWANSSQEQAITGGDFFAVSFTIAAGYSVSLSSFDESYRRSTTGPDHGAIQYSINGGDFIDISSFSYAVASSSGSMLPTIDLSGVAALQNLAAGTTVSIRQANWRESSGGAATGTWYVFDVNSPGDDLFLTGTAVANGAGPLRGDINQDDHVNSGDISAMLDALCNLSSYPGSHRLAPEIAAQVLDVNLDTKVNNADLQALLNYLKIGHGNMMPVPEPGQFVLATLGAAACTLVSAVRRRCP